MSACRSCQAEIWWAETTQGKRIPLDAESTPDGNIVVEREGVGQAPPVVAVRPPSLLDPEDLPRYHSHFVTCPNADQHRKARHA